MFFAESSSRTSIRTTLELTERLASIAVLVVPGLLVASALVAKSNAKAAPAPQLCSVTAHLVANAASLVLARDIFLDAIETPVVTLVATLLLTSKALLQFSEMDAATNCLAHSVISAHTSERKLLRWNKVANGVLVFLDLLIDALAAVNRRA